MFDCTQWVDADRLIIPISAPASKLQAVFFNSYTGKGALRNSWETVDLSNELPANAVAIHVTGTLIITHGENPELADLMIYFRMDDSINSNYAHQAIEATIGDGQRSTMAAWIPLTQYKTFQWKWNTATFGSYPQYSSYGANLHVDAVAIKTNNN